MSGPTITVDPAPAGAGVFFHPEPARNWRHFLGLEGMSREEILETLDRADAYLERLDRGIATDELAGVSVLLAFFEDSTRTRISFELAAKRLGAIAVTFSESGSSVSKGETLLDTLRTVVAMGVDLVVVRHAAAGAPALMSRYLDAGIINAGDGAHEHPTQGLLDLLTLRQAWGGRFVGRRVAIVGDLMHSRVARSAVHGLTTLGAEVVATGPATLIPRELETLGCAVAPTLEEALVGADAVMALRIQHERMEKGLLPSLGEYARVWGLTPERMRLLPSHAVVLHPGPMNRGLEIAPEVADGERSVVLRQVRNGVAVRCAVLERCARAVRSTW